MSKLDLKAAMDSLQVKKPLKLQARQPQFKAPTPEAPHPKVPKNEVAHVERPQPKAALNEHPKLEGGYFKLPHDAFYDEQLRSLSGDEFRLFLWMSSQGWRYRDSDGSLSA